MWGCGVDSKLWRLVTWHCCTYDPKNWSHPNKSWASDILTLILINHEDIVTIYFKGGNNFVVPILPNPSSGQNSMLSKSGYFFLRLLLATKIKVLKKST